ncbi:FAD-dependent oxidoreductase, partial [uncultured Nevskia sp.]|uniref:FAD-dependent oxidoreductase n=1 Tax=uncultured Nevskia sp. TaxID=228950 RepID=UPI0025F4BB21
MIDKKTAAVGDEPQLRTRRALLKGLAAGSVAAAGSLPALSHAAGPAATKWAAEADVLIVGTGIAGTAAALAAASKGASVIMLEKMPFKGGTTAKSGGVFWIPDNAWLASQGIADNRADALRYMVRLSYPHRYVESDALLGISQAEYDLIATFFDNAAKVVKTLSASTGLKPMPWYTWEGKPFPDYYAQLPECKVQRGRSLVPDITGHAERIVWPQNGGGGESLLWQLQQGFDKLPIQMLLEHQVQDLIRDSAGAVIGLKVDRGDAEPVNFRAKKAVIFCSGGFTHSIELSRAHLKGHI